MTEVQQEKLVQKAPQGELVRMAPQGQLAQKGLLVIPGLRALLDQEDHWELFVQTFAPVAVKVKHM